jgi:ABC-type polysaccharide/polyol phosphate transport system ATPase subunit
LSALIEAESVCVRFLFDRQRRVVTPNLARLRRRGDEMWGLRELSFGVAPGEGVALIGPSGSGKTTLLRLIASVLTPDSGILQIDGRVAALLSIEAGLLELLTGRENAQLLGVLAGVRRSRVLEMLDGVKELSRLGPAFERPVSSYSQGMRARLGYAVAAQADPDILVLDEVHEAFDHEYRAVVEAHVGSIRAAGGIVIAAGHDHALLGRLCDRALLLRDGQLEGSGPFVSVVENYLQR